MSRAADRLISTRSCSTLKSLRTACDCAASASFSSKRSVSTTRSPVHLIANGTAADRSMAYMLFGALWIIRFEQEREEKHSCRSDAQNYIGIYV